MDEFVTAENGRCFVWSEDELNRVMGLIALDEWKKVSPNNGALSQEAVVNAFMGDKMKIFVFSYASEELDYLLKRSFCPQSAKRDFFVPFVFSGISTIEERKAYFLEPVG